MPRPRPLGRPRWRRFSPLLALRRHPRAWWLVTGVAAVVAAGALASTAARAEAAREAWGTTRAVLVVRVDVEAGDPVEPGDVDLEDRPVALLPPSALDRLPEGAVAADDLVAGEVLVAARLAGAGLSPTAARVPDGSRAVAVPAEPGLTPPLLVGDRVDVLVALAGGEGERPPGFTLVPGALVVAVDEDAVTVAVPRDDAPRVAVALASGAVTLALAGA